MRIKDFRDVLAAKNVDLAILLNSSADKKDINIFYLTQVDLDFCCLLLTKTREYFLIPGFEKDRVKETSLVKRVLGLRRSKLFDKVKGVLKRNKIKVKRIGINKKIISLNEFKILKKEFPKIKFVDISHTLEDLREHKDEREVEIIKKACKYTDKVLKKCIDNFKSFRTELDVRNFLEFETKKIEGCELSFDPIVASGKGGAMPHYKSKNIKLRKGFCVIDFGIKYRGYHADVTRTIYVGKPSQKEIEDYELVLSVQRKILSGLREGGKIEDYYNFARKKLGKDFTHALGHGLGVRIHELPNLSPMNKKKFKEITIFTVEPGVYRKDKYGIRIEDDILILRGKVEVLTKVKKELVVV